MTMPTVRGVGEAGLRILIADDSDLYRDVLKVELEEDFGFEVVGEAGDGASAIELARELKPDVALIDLTLPGISGYEAMSIISWEVPGVRLIGLSMHAQSEVEPLVRRAGAHGYMEKDRPTGDLAREIRRVAQED